jgi:molybdopterin molybdotransferase
MPPLFTCAEALASVSLHMRQLSPPAMETVPLHEALGRVLAQTVTADRDQPPFPRSTRDGYAMRAEDAATAVTLMGTIRAGEQWTGRDLQAAEAIEIMTGAPVPAGADAVVMLEHVALSGDVLTLQAGRTLKPGENIVPRAAESRAGDVLLRAGIRMTPAEIALAASVGAAEVSVFAKPTAAILATGDELVGLRDTPSATQIRNSNSHALAALVQSFGGDPRVLAPAADTRASLHERIADARGAQMLVLTGGVSAGKYDLVEEVLLELGGEFFFTGVAIQPGKPAVFGRLPATEGCAEQWIFGLPGNPVSTQVTALLFAMPMLRALGGEAAPAPFFVQALLAEDVPVRPGLTRFLPAHVSSSLVGATVRPTGWQGSGDLNANARANAYLVVPPDVERLEANGIATVLLRGLS